MRAGPPRDRRSGRGHRAFSGRPVPRTALPGDTTESPCVWENSAVRRGSREGRVELPSGRRRAWRVRRWGAVGAGRRRCGPSPRGGEAGRSGMGTPRRWAPYVEARPGSPLHGVRPRPVAWSLRAGARIRGCAPRNESHRRFPDVRPTLRRLAKDEGGGAHRVCPPPAGVRRVRPVCALETVRHACRSAMRGRAVLRFGRRRAGHEGSAWMPRLLCVARSDVSSASVVVLPTHETDPSRILVMQLRYDRPGRLGAARRRRPGGALACVRVVWNDRLRDRKEAHAAGLPYAASAELSRLRVTRDGSPGLRVGEPVNGAGCKGRRPGARTSGRPAGERAPGRAR